ncbi:ANTAR domain-containing protein [Actinosynnema sp. NPDC002837]
MRAGAGGAARPDLVLSEGEREASTLREALAGRGTTSQAVGLLMAGHRCDADAAFRLITAMSQRRNVKARDVAAELVARFVAGLPSGRSDVPSDG